MPLNDTEMAVERNVAAYGWHAMGVTGEPGFMYTCGLTTSFGHPEVVLFGLPVRLAHSVLSGLVEEVRRGRSYERPGVYDGVLVGMPVAARTVHPSQFADHLGYAMSHFLREGDRGQFTAVQLFWPDRSRRFPFEAACDPGSRDAQTRLDVPRRVSPATVRAAGNPVGAAHPGPPISSPHSDHQ